MLIYFFRKVFMILLLIIAFSIVLPIYISYRDKKKKYENSQYYASTKNSWNVVRNDIGLYGEYLSYSYLADTVPGNKLFLFNTYLPKTNGKTTEIDLIMIHETGIYVFESKNYSGWIFGNDSQQKWTQTFGNGQKEHFYNPIFQNSAHIKAIKDVLHINSEIPIYSIVVFSERCTLKKITVTAQNTFVIKRNDLSRTVLSIIQNSNYMISQQYVNIYYEKLFPYSQVTDEVKKQHIETIRNGTMNHPVMQTIDTVTPSENINNNANLIICPDRFCPLCGDKIFLEEKSDNRVYTCANTKCDYKFISEKTTSL